MNKQDRQILCKEYIDKLYMVITNKYTAIASCNADCSCYLVPNGTESELTYYSKPAFSFRYSDHWNWYANVNKCDKERYIQCFSRDLPYAKKRKGPGLPSSPIYATSVMLADETGAYHCIFGEIFDRKTKKWGWKETPIEDVVRMVEERKVW